jgi:hypothetical protein
MHAYLVTCLQKELGEHSLDTVQDFRCTFGNLSQFLMGICKKQELHFNAFFDTIRDDPAFME